MIFWTVRTKDAYVLNWWSRSSKIFHLIENSLLDWRTTRFGSCDSDDSGFVFLHVARQVPLAGSHTSCRIDDVLTRPFSRRGRSHLSLRDAWSCSSRDEPLAFHHSWNNARGFVFGFDIVGVDFSLFSDHGGLMYGSWRKRLIWSEQVLGQCVAL